MLPEDDVTRLRHMLDAANEAQEFWWTIEIRGDILKFDGQSVWDDEILPIWDSPGSRVLKKTNVNVDALEICNED